MHVFLYVVALHTSRYLPLKSPVKIRAELFAVPPSARCSSAPVDIHLSQCASTSIRVEGAKARTHCHLCLCLSSFYGYVVIGPRTDSCSSEAAVQGQLSRSTSRSSDSCRVSPLFDSLLHAGKRQRDEPADSDVNRFQNFVTSQREGYLKCVRLCTL